MSGRDFTSAFAAGLDAYLTLRQNMGHYGNSRISYLREFDAWCSEHDRAVFDKGTVEGWVSAQLQSSGRYRSWMSYIHDFGRWLQATGASDAYVLSGRWKAPFVPPRPYLLSAREIELFFTAAAVLQSQSPVPSPQSPWRWQAVAFFTLMHSCGLRTGQGLPVVAGGGHGGDVGDDVGAVLGAGFGWPAQPHGRRHRGGAQLGFRGHEQLLSPPVRPRLSLGSAVILHGERPASG